MKSEDGFQNFTYYTSLKRNKFSAAPVGRVSAATAVDQPSRFKTSFFHPLFLLASRLKTK